MKIFIAGCARSGTTLTQRLMGCFDGAYIFEQEAPVTAFCAIERRAPHLVVKRTAWCHEVLPSLPADIGLLYCLRHPFDVLTSTHPRTARARRFHVRPSRWRDEYAALRALRLHQPERKIFFLRYEDMVTGPDAVQARIGERFGLTVARKFSQAGEDIFSHSMRKWEADPELVQYLQEFPAGLHREIAIFCLEFGYALPDLAGACAAQRLAEEPIVRADMLPADLGGNINGPSLIGAPAWLPNPLGRYYLYFAHHAGKHIRLAVADRLEGPWRVHPGGTLRLEDAPMCRGHIASPDVHVDHESREIRMIFHGIATAAAGQKSFLATSQDGLAFTASPVVLAESYLRVVPWQGRWLGMSLGGELVESGSFAGPYHSARKFAFDSHPAGQSGATVRHVGLRVRGSMLDVFYTRIGDAPESVWRGQIDLSEGQSAWRVRNHRIVLSPERGWEGADLPLEQSRRGQARGPENALRDPALYTEDGVTYLLYAVAGEQGIAIARLVEGDAPPSSEPIVGTPANSDAV